jgi:adenosine deaminase
MSLLLCSVGTSPLVVAEAFLSAPSPYRAVRCLTSASAHVDATILETFFADHPEVDFRLERIEGLVDLRDQAEHDAYEERLFRWYLQALGDFPGTLPDVCLAGGFKSMVAALQKAAHLCGAARVFHVLCDADLPDPVAPGQTRLRPPQSLDELATALAQGALRTIELGAEGGWPSVRALRSEVTSDAPLLPLIRARLDEINRRAGAWDDVAELPFPRLALLAPRRRAWLEDPLSPGDREWVARLPKIELHCHLGGFATEGPELADVRAAAEDPARLPPLFDHPPPPGWPRPAEPIPLDAYMRLGDNTGSALLKDPGCLRRHCKRLYAHLSGENILYAEIRCSPANYADPARGRSPWDVLTQIKETFDALMAAAAQETAPRVNLIIIANRLGRGDYRAAIARHLSLAITAAGHWTNPEHCRVVGVDLAGFEDRETRAVYYQTDFEPVHRCGLAVTAHAGENDDAEGIWQAVFKLNARRIGHALRLTQSPDLLRSIAERGIGVEMCPYANFQIHGFAPMPGHPPYPLTDYLRAGVPVTVNTDNPGISRASLTENLLFLASLSPGLTRLDLLRLQRHAALQAFLPATARQRLLAQFEAALPFE